MHRHAALQEPARAAAVSVSRPLARQAPAPRRDVPGSQAPAALLGDFSRVPARNPADLGGLSDGASTEEDINGRTAGEALGDFGRPIGTFLGNVVGSIAGALGGASISSTSTAAPFFGPHGTSRWPVTFQTSGRSGWIVQEITNTFRAQTTAGAPVTRLPPPIPHFFEAWTVNATGAIAEHDRAGNNDVWQRASRGNNTQGHWSTTGKLHFTTTDPATQGFVRRNPATNAGILLSSTSAPSNLGIARLHRYAQGTWDSTGATPTHTGSAGP
ncbi:MAG: hypothetical protein ACREHE_14230 [Rhizomicrobium sp.]